jgi:superfamily II DNA helicase RecQ
MPYRFFIIPTHNAQEPEAELNAVLNSQRVVSVDRHFVAAGNQSFWAICVDFVAGSSVKGSTFPTKERIDYKEKLKPEQFKVFAQLRDLRKQLALAEAIPVYTIFSNEQLARMVVDRVTTKAALERIDGVGEARVAKYGSAFIELMTKLVQVQHETSGRPV